MSEPSRAVWLRSTRCVSDHHCVEAAAMGDVVGLRNSQRPGLSLTFSKEAWHQFLDGITAEEFPSAQN